MICIVKALAGDKNPPRARCKQHGRGRAGVRASARARAPRAVPFKTCGAATMITSIILGACVAVSSYHHHFVPQGPQHGDAARVIGSALEATSCEVGASNSPPNDKTAPPTMLARKNPRPQGAGNQCTRRRHRKLVLQMLMERMYGLLACSAVCFVPAGADGSGGSGCWGASERAVERGAALQGAGRDRRRSESRQRVTGSCCL